MQMLGPLDYVSILLRIDQVELSVDEYGRPYVGALAMLRLSPNAERDIPVSLWGEREHAAIIVADKDFVARDAIMEGVCRGNHDNPYARARVGIRAIWIHASEPVLMLVGRIASL